MDRIRKFFDDFVADFSSFDGEVIATRYVAPYTAIDSDGNVTLYDRVDDIAVLFQGYLDAYYMQGIKTCRASKHAAIETLMLLLLTENAFVRLSHGIC